MCSCLGRPSHERHNSWQGSHVEIICPKKFQDLESQVLNSAISLSRLRDMELQKNVTVQNLGIQVLLKNIIFHNCGCQIFKRIFKCVLVLEDQVMKDIILGKGLMFQFFTPKSLKTWKAKSWIVQSLSRLGDMELQKNVTVQNLGYQVLKEKCKISELWLPSLDNHVHLCSCLGRPSHERHKSLLYCWKSILHEVSRLGKPSLE